MRTEAYEGQKSSVDRGHAPDGRKLWRFSQSKLKQVDDCPEKARQIMLGLVPDRTTDSNALGHAVHEVIELSVNEMIDGTGPLHLSDMADLANDTFDDEMENGGQWVKDKSASVSHNKIWKCLSTWYAKVMPTLRPVATEVNFGPLIFHEDEHRIIEVAGQIDYIDETGLADWKTTGRKWEPWEHQRWDIQPTLYTWAEKQGWYPLDGPEAEYPWTWHVFNVNGDYQHITTTRNAIDWNWLRQRCVDLAVMLEAELPNWHRNDASALCSPKWCPAWEGCKGALYGSNWPTKSGGR